MAGKPLCRKSHKMESYPEYHIWVLTSLNGSQAWAIASGKINEFPNDKARWKTNFRCALNNLSVRFKMIEDNSKNSDDPHKIYQIINTECK